MTDPTPTPIPDADGVELPDVGRRRVLGRAAAAVAAAGAAAVATVTPAGAGNGDPLAAGSTSNVASAPTGLRVDSPAAPYGFGVTDGAIANFPVSGVVSAYAGSRFTTAVAATAAGSARIGVVGSVSGANGHGGQFLALGANATGVFASALSSQSVTDGVGASAIGGRAHLHLIPHNEPPQEEFWDPEVGDVVCDTFGSLWFATSGPSGPRYVKLAGASTAGAFHAITPTRSVDSRIAGGRLSSGQTRTADLAVNLNGGALVPYRATAAVVNVTITATEGAGFLTLFPFGVSRPTASTINWSASGQTVANGATIALGSAQRLSVYCGGSGGPSTELLIDVTGYYR